MLGLQFMDGNFDFAAFFGKDPIFKKWATDLYQYYWKQGKAKDNNRKTIRK